VARKWKPGRSGESGLGGFDPTCGQANIANFPTPDRRATVLTWSAGTFYPGRKFILAKQLSMGQAAGHPAEPGVQEPMRRTYSGICQELKVCVRCRSLKCFMPGSLTPLDFLNETRRLRFEQAGCNGKAGVTTIEHRA